MGKMVICEIKLELFYTWVETGHAFDPDRAFHVRCMPTFLYQRLNNKWNDTTLLAVSV